MFEVDDAKMQFDSMESSEQELPESEMSEEDLQSLLAYLMSRLKQDQKIRGNRIQRYARIDQLISTWQKLSKEDSIRDSREDNTGKSQALPVNLPIAQAHIDDATAFYAEIFAPLGGNYYADPGELKKSEAVKALTRKMNQDSKYNNYYANVCSVMRAQNKYNFGGFHVFWNPGTALSESAGNVCEALDVYNFLYDPSIKDVQNLHADGEWSAMVRVRNRLWLIRKAIEGGLIDADKILNPKRGEQSNSYEYGKAQFYRHPPKQTNVEEDGSDTKTSEDGGTGLDWASYGLSTDTDAMVEIDGHEVILMYCWINIKQFNLEESADNEDTNPIQLYRFTIVDGRWLIAIERQVGATELPTYTARLNQDELKEAARSVGEHLRPFQRLMSFQVNTYIESIRSALWGLKAVDPSMFDIDKIRNGETSAILVSKKPGQDVRAGIQSINASVDSRQNLADSASVLELMKTFFPNQSMPAQIASMDRAVTSQVSAVLQGSMRKLHMFVRLLDSALMLPVRMAQYRNIALYDPDKAQFSAVTPEEVAELLNSGLGQLSREAAAEQIRSLIFALIQNPNASQGIDMMGLWKLYSLLLNIGTDLGQFMLQPTLSNTGEQVPAGTQSGAAMSGATESMPGQTPGIVS